MTLSKLKAQEKEVEIGASTQHFINVIKTKNKEIKKLESYVEKFNERVVEEATRASTIQSKLEKEIKLNAEKDLELQNLQNTKTITRATEEEAIKLIDKTSQEIELIDYDKYEKLLIKKYF